MKAATMRAHWAQAPKRRTTMLAVVPPQPEELVVQVAAVQGKVPLSELLSPSRRAGVARARKVAMLVLNEELGWGPSRIGEWLDRDHGTVSYGLETARVDAGIRRDAAQVRMLVDERLAGYGVR